MNATKEIAPVAAHLHPARAVKLLSAISYTVDRTVKDEIAVVRFVWEGFDVEAIWRPGERNIHTLNARPSSAQRQTIRQFINCIEALERLWY